MIALTVQRLFSLSLSLSHSLFVYASVVLHSRAGVCGENRAGRAIPRPRQRSQPAREKPSGDDDDDDGVGTREREGKGERGERDRGKRRPRSRSGRERERERERRGRPRKQVPGQTGRPTGDRPTGRRTQVTHPDSTNNQTPRALCPFGRSALHRAAAGARCSSSSRLPSPSPAALAICRLRLRAREEAVAV